MGTSDEKKICAGCGNLQGLQCKDHRPAIAGLPAPLCSGATSPPSYRKRRAVRSGEMQRRAGLWARSLNGVRYHETSPKSVLLRNGGDESGMPSFPGRRVRFARRFASARSRSTRCRSSTVKRSSGGRVLPQTPQSTFFRLYITEPQLGHLGGMRKILSGDQHS
jgi:hypothetical protein